jgi:hypothetical protein
MRLHLLCTSLLLAGCYGQAEVARDVNAAYRGANRAVIEAQIGQAEVSEPQPDGALVLRWIRKGTRYDLPSGHFRLNVTATSFDLDAAARPGVVEHYDYELAAALVDPSSRVLRFESRRLLLEVPDSLNVRSGAIFGLHGGLGSLDDATSVMPSLGVYLGGMLGPRHALLGSYSLVHGRDDGRTAQGHAWALALQYWPLARLNVRTGAAMVLDLDPGFEDPTLSPGAVGAISYALVRAGSFVLDARFDLTVSTAAAFGMFGVGVNVN